ncbi:hypothetical protein [Campylobacter sp. RM12651]|uniref:hypothetical protein n=1 Tax=Campylobacter sp. RM12651 TaxID=1660079 RepID=UPI001EFC16BB|nr:hypothetical protein [Campylobacter sp. RM12651]ULO04522.1 hypothetical protein AVBRAN_a0040 [Campylobacter sp. RM12651]
MIKLVDVNGNIILDALSDFQKERLNRVEQIKDIAKLAVWFGKLDYIWLDSDNIEEPTFIIIKDIDIIKEYILMFNALMYEYKASGEEVYTLAEFIQTYNKYLPNNKMIPFLKKHLKIDRFEDYEENIDYGLIPILHCSEYVCFEKSLEEAIEYDKRFFPCFFRGQNV